MPFPSFFRISKETFLRNLLITVLYGFSSAMILLLFIAHEDGISHRNSVTSEFSETIQGTAHKPSVARVLVPLMIRGTSAVTPSSLKAGIQSFVKKRSAAIEGFEWQEEYYFEYVVACVILFALLMGYAFALRYLLTFYYPKDPAITNFAPVFGVLLLALFFRYRHFLYDPATLCLSTLALGLILHRKNLWYYPVFLLACLNKETTILLAGVFFVFQLGQMPLKILVRHVALQGVIWGLVQIVLFVTFRNNPGSSTELHLFDHNLALIHDPLSLAYFILVIAFIALIRHARLEEQTPFPPAGVLDNSDSRIGSLSVVGIF